MAILSGLSSIKKAIDALPSRANSSERDLVRSLESGQPPRKIQFLQEIDPDSELYNSDNGSAVVAVEREHPDYFYYRLVERLDDDGADYGVENGWDQKINLYINVMDLDTKEVYYIGRSALGGLGKQILESAESRGKLTDAVWNIKKTGTGIKGTRYELTPIDFGQDLPEFDKEDLIDFEEQVLNNFPYDQQAGEVKRFEEGREEAAGGASGGSGSKGKDEGDDLW